jgi:hypothetical protein
VTPVVASEGTAFTQKSKGKKDTKGNGDTKKKELCSYAIYRDKETERQRDRETERQRDRETERQSDLGFLTWIADGLW